MQFIQYVLFIFLLFTLQTAYATTKVIVDNDCDIPDVMALLYLLQRPEIEIKAVTIASDGWAHCEPAKRNILGLLKMMNRTDIPVACGREKPLKGHHQFPSKLREEGDSLSNTAHLLPEVQINDKQNAADLIIETIKQSKEPITILAIAPLTNLAEALQKEPSIKNNIKQIYIMGGALHVPGNIKEDPNAHNQVAEWNIYIDPYAANVVFKQNIPIVLLSLDITNKTPIDSHFYNQLKQNHQSRAADFIYILFNKNLDLIRNKTLDFWDALAAAILTDESIAEFKTESLKVILSPEHLSGAIVIDNKKGNKIRVVSAINKNLFESHFMKSLNST